MREKGLLLDVLINPQAMLELDIRGWNKILLESHILKLRARLAHDAMASGLWDEIPLEAQRILTNARIETEARHRKIRWEVNRVNRALFGFEDKIILVKGAAYLARNLACASGRTSVDIDILVAKKNLDIVENFLFMAGYGSRVLNDYDQQYYREWGHELPPIIHPDRLIEVDVHHNILQVTNRLSPNIDLMITEAKVLEGNLYVLCDEDMLLHSIVHQFVDGTVKGSLRNLLEQHDMFLEFSKRADFWPCFMKRAEALNFTRPVFYSLRYCRLFLETDMPDEVTFWAEKFAPNPLTLKVMDLMILRAMVPFGQGRSKLTDYLATNGLYIRSHALRMPPMLLATHLTRKFLRRLGFSKA